MYKSTSRYIQHRKEQSGAKVVSPGRKKGSRNQDLKRIRAAQQCGEVLVGSVKSVQSYGAFIALGSVDGGGQHYDDGQDKYAHDGFFQREEVFPVDPIAADKWPA